MKFPLIVCVFLLTVSSSQSVNITVNGTEGRGVSITCPYPEGFRYAYSYKYFYRGHYKDRVTILESDGMQTFAMNGRFSLKDNRQTSSFTVSISDLKMDDAGPYGCKAGHEYENYHHVELIVIRAPETTTRVQISTTSISPYTHSNTEHTNTALPLDLASVAGGLGSVLLVLTLCCGTFIILKKRKRKSRTALFQQNMQRNTETDLMSEIPNTDFNMGTPSSNQTPASHLNTCTFESTVYATVTNHQPDSNPTHTHSTNQVTDTAGDYNYLTATHPQNATPDEDPLNAPRFSIDFLG